MQIFALLLSTIGKHTLDVYLISVPIGDNLGSKWKVLVLGTMYVD